MRTWILGLFLATAALWQPAQARTFNQAELDALLAPVALYPDTVLSHILVAATHPDEVEEAAEWSRANPQLAGEAAVQAAEPMPWHPSVKALAAFPDLLARMAESPQWTEDLGEAFLEQEPHVMDTVQALRRRAQASGHLQSNAQQHIYPQGDAIAIYPAQPQIVYLPYYDPYVVYGPWWWHSYRPVYWRPWHPRPALFVSVHKPFHHHHAVDWHRRHVVRHVVQHHHIVQHHHVKKHQHVDQHRHVEKRRFAPVTIHNHAHPHRPIVQGARLPEARHEHRAERREHRPEHRQWREQIRNQHQAQQPPARFGVHREPRHQERAAAQHPQHRAIREERRDHPPEQRQWREQIRKHHQAQQQPPARFGVHKEPRREHRGG